MAQLAEQLICNQQVIGSSPIIGFVPLAGHYRVWTFSSAGRASALQAEGHRFESYRSHFADVAQLAEQLICNQQVNGSSPFIGFVMIIKAFS